MQTEITDHNTPAEVAPSRPIVSQNRCNTAAGFEADCDSEIINVHKDAEKDNSLSIQVSHVFFDFTDDNDV